MGAWSLYFLAKVGMYGARLIGLHWWPNLLFALFLAWPLSQRRWRIARQVVAWPCAIALLYYDSYLPPVSRVLSQAGAVASFSPSYLVELVLRFVSWPVVAALAVLVLLYVLLARHLRFATLAIVAVLVAPWLPSGGMWRADPAMPGPGLPGAQAVAAGQAAPLQLAQLDDRLRSFYGAQQQQAVAFKAAAPSFDLVVLSVCSLSWDDLAFAGLSNHGVFAGMDVVFKQFNSAASYSGPAVLRLLHGTCGQRPQSALYEAAPDECRLFPSLAAAGYEPAWLMNHDGHFDRFAEQVRDQGGMSGAPFDVSPAAVAMSAFDGTPIRSDFDVLSQWWRNQQAGAGDRHHAVLYNTITLHDGNRVPGLKSRSSVDTYKPRLSKMLADFERFFELVQASGRPTVVVLVPEHGGAVRGDALQVSGLRELPTPSITHVPAAVKLLGFPNFQRSGETVLVNQPSSYLGLVALISRLHEAGTAVADRQALQTLVQGLPATEWVAENDSTVLLRSGSQAFLRGADGQWAPFAAP